MRVVKRLILIAVLAAALIGSIALIAAVAGRLPSRSLTRFIPDDAAYVAQFERSALFSIAETSDLKWAKEKRTQWLAFEDVSRTRLFEIIYFNVQDSDQVLLRFNDTPFATQEISSLDFSKTLVPFIDDQYELYDLGKNVYALLKGIERNHLADGNLYIENDQRISLLRRTEVALPPVLSSIINLPVGHTVAIDEERSFIRIEVSSNDLTENQLVSYAASLGDTLFAGPDIDYELYNAHGSALVARLVSTYLISPDRALVVLRSSSSSAANDNSFLLTFRDPDDARNAIEMLGGALGGTESNRRLPDGSEMKEIVRALPEPRLLIQDGIELIQWSEEDLGRYLYLVEKNGVSYLSNRAERFQYLNADINQIQGLVQTCTRQTGEIVSIVLAQPYTQGLVGTANYKFRYVKQKNMTNEVIESTCIAKNR